MAMPSTDDSAPPVRRLYVVTNPVDPLIENNYGCSPAFWRRTSQARTDPQSNANIASGVIQWLLMDPISTVSATLSVLVTPEADHEIFNAPLDLFFSP